MTGGRISGNDNERDQLVKDQSVDTKAEPDKQK